MAEKRLTELPNTQFSGLEYSNILNDIYNLVRENPVYNEVWDDFMSSNAGVMITEIFAWITDQLATRIDWNVNENFIGTATQRSSIINLLKIIGYKFNLPVSSNVPVSVTFNDPIGDYIFKPAYSDDGVFTTKTLTALDKKGNTKFFEAIEFDTSASKFQYKLEIKAETGNVENPILAHTIDFYEGLTKIEEFEATTTQAQTFNLSEGPVIRNSVEIYRVEIDTFSVEHEYELLQVNSFLDLKAQEKFTPDAPEDGNEIPYILNVLEDDKVEIEFASSSLVSNDDRRLTQGTTLRIFYRIGGGIDGNISRGTINFSEDINNTTVVYKNNTEGVGAEDSETIEHAAYAGPLQTKTAGKAVTAEDYDIILSGFTNILLSKAYGQNNLPDNFYDKYGIFINPLEVLNYVIIKKSGWEEVPTNLYKYANWGTFNLENYFNEIIAFKSGNFGYPIGLNVIGADLDPLEYADILTDNEDISNIDDITLNFEEVYDYDNQGGRIFKNFTILRTPMEFKNNLWIENPDIEGEYIANPYLKASITTTNYNDEDYGTYKKIEDIPNHYITDATDSYLYGDYNSTGLPRPEISEDINAYFLSKKNVYGGGDGVDISDSHNLLNLNIDRHGDVSIDLTNNGAYSDTISLVNLVTVINTALSEAYELTFSYQDFGMQIPDTGAFIDEIEDNNYYDYQLSVNSIDYDVNTAGEQTYDQLLTQINDGFEAQGMPGYQDFDHTPGTEPTYTVINETVYDIGIDDGTGNVNIVLEAVTGTSLEAIDLVNMLNKAIILDGTVEAFAEISRDGYIRIASNLTGTGESIALTAGTAETDLIANVVGSPETAVNGTLLEGGNYVATFVQADTNAACSDIRISRKNNVGSVVLADSGSVSYDLLGALKLLPLSTEPVSYGGNYTNVASIEDVDTEEKYIKLTSPNSGYKSKIEIKISPSGIDRDATLNTFGLNYITSSVTEFECFGERKMTIIFRDTEEDDFANIIYEHGSIHFNSNNAVEADNDPLILFLNYITSNSDTLKLGSYYTDNFEETDPRWKIPAYRLYNTIYKADPESAEETAEIIDYDVSDFQIKFSSKEIVNNSLFADIGDTEIDLVPTSYIKRDSIAVADGALAYLNGLKLNVTINDNVAEEITFTTNGSTTVSQLLVMLNNNTNINTYINEKEGGNSVFATDNEDGTIALNVYDTTKTGKLIIDDGVATPAGALLFDFAAGEKDTTYPPGDYYLEHIVDTGASTPEELFGYFTINIITSGINNVPDLPFYCHIINDRRHKFLDSTIYRLHTDEDDLLDQMKKYKIAGVEHSFRNPIFATFDVSAEVFVEGTYSQEQVKDNLETTLREYYSLSTTTLAENINKSEFIGKILNVSGIRYINIFYFGRDFVNQDIYEDQPLEIETAFDEIMVLSDDIFNNSGVKQHGLLFSYTTL